MFELTFEEKVGDAEAAFYSRAHEIGDENLEADAWANAFAVEVHAEYSDDLERWTVALATLEMYVNQR